MKNNRATEKKTKNKQIQLKIQSNLEIIYFKPNWYVEIFVSILKIKVQPKKPQQQ